MELRISVPLYHILHIAYSISLIHLEGTLARNLHVEASKLLLAMSALNMAVLAVQQGSGYNV